jgi:hypothetical protein
MTYVKEKEKSGYRNYAIPNPAFLNLTELRMS